MRGFRLFEKPLGVFATVPPLGITGLLPNYEQGTSYEGRLDIVNSIGNCTVELLDNNLPPGSTVRVDQLTKEVVVEWPPYSPNQPRTEVINSTFQTEDLTGWFDKRGRSWAVENSIGLNAPSDPPNWATDGDYVAVMRGVGKGDHILESIKYPAIPGQSVMARSYWDQGPSNKDNNNLYTAMAFYDAAGNAVEYRGDEIHDRTNKNRHWSTISMPTPSWAVEQAVRLIAGRRNSRNRWIAVDAVEVSGFTFGTGVDDGDDFYLTIRVRDGANRVAYWTGNIWFQSVWYTSKPYPIFFREDGIGTLSSTTELKHWNQFVEPPLQSEPPLGTVSALVLFIHDKPDKTHNELPIGTLSALTLFVHTDPSRTHNELPVGTVSALVSFKHLNESQTLNELPIGTVSTLTEFIHAI